MAEASLTLESFAELSAELALYPHDFAATRARYRMSDDASWAATQAKWQLRIQFDRALYAKFAAAYEAHMARIGGAPPSR
jgi:hypothetical protein